MVKSYEAALNECISYNEQHMQTFKSVVFMKFMYSASRAVWLISHSWSDKLLSHRDEF